MRRELTPKELAALERVDDEVDRFFLGNMWREGPKPKGKTSLLSIVLTLIYVVALGGILFATGGPHNVAVFLTLGLSIFGLLVSVVFLGQVASLVAAEDDPDWISDVTQRLEKIIGGERSILVANKATYRLGVVFDVAFWIALAYTGHLIVAIIVMVADIVTRVALAISRDHLRFEGIPVLRRAEERRFYEEH